MDVKKKLLEYLYKDVNSPVSFTSVVGDRVRIEKYKHVFQKGYLPRFTVELFTVAQVHDERTPVVYRLRDSKNEIIKGWFYANDLCKTLENNEQMYDIEKIIKKRKQHGVDHVFVKWKGFGARYNSWIPASSVTWKNI